MTYSCFFTVLSLYYPNYRLYKKKIFQNCEQCLYPPEHRYENLIFSKKILNFLLRQQVISITRVLDLFYCG